MFLRKEVNSGVIARRVMYELTCTKKTLSMYLFYISMNYEKNSETNSMEDEKNPSQ